MSKARGGNATNGKDDPTLRCLITSCCDVDAIADTRFLLEVSERMLKGKIFCTFGCHPHNYREYDDKYEARLIEEIEACGSRVVAFGECGLDYCKNWWQLQRPSERQRMIDVFSRQARLSVARGLPLVVHARDAPEDTIMVLGQCLPREHKVHVHAHQGSVEMMQEILEMLPNSVFGVGGMLLMDNEGAINTARYCPLSRLLLETDAPYLAKLPCDILRLAMRVAEIKNLTPAEVLQATTANCERFYGIPA